MRPGPDRVPFARDFRLEARGGTREFQVGSDRCRNVAEAFLLFFLFPSAESEAHPRSISSRIFVSEFPGHRDRDCDSEQGRRTDAEPVRNWLHESARSLTEVALNIP
jgi:hypothetical protein